MNAKELINKVLLEQGLSQKALASLLGQSEQNISRWSNGVHRVPYEVLCLISYYFDIPLAEALDFENVIRPYRRLAEKYKKPDLAGRSATDDERRALLRLSEDLQDCEPGYPDLLRDSALLNFSLREDAFDGLFRKGDRIFYEALPEEREGYVICEDEAGQPQLRLLELHERHLLLIAGRAGERNLLLNKGARLKSRILGRLRYLVRGFEHFAAP